MAISLSFPQPEAQPEHTGECAHPPRWTPGKAIVQIVWSLLVDLQEVCEAHMKLLGC